MEINSTIKMEIIIMAMVMAEVEILFVVIEDEGQHDSQDIPTHETAITVGSQDISFSSGVYALQTKVLDEIKNPTIIIIINHIKTQISINNTIIVHS